MTFDFQRYFSNVEHWREINGRVRTSIERLLPLCNDRWKNLLENQLLFVNRRWKEVIDSMESFRQNESIRKKREEFYHRRAKLLETLERVERWIHETIPCTRFSLTEQETRLNVNRIDFPFPTELRNLRTFESFSEFSRDPFFVQVNS